VVWGIRNFRKPGRQLAFFYGLEVPLVLFCLYRIFLVRELVPGLALVILAFFVACAAFAYELHRQAPGRRPEQVVRLCAATVAGLTSLYLGAILAFYVPPAAVGLAKAFFAFEWLDPLFSLLKHGGILWLIAAALLGVSALLFLAAPFALVTLHLRSFARVLASARHRLGKTVTYALVSATVLVGLGLFVALNRQPQHRAFARLAEPPASERERARLLAAADDLRDGLAAAYLAPYRYLSTWQRNTHLEAFYREVFGIGKGPAAAIATPQKWLLSPFLYDGESLAADQDRAKNLYAEFFDTPLERGERASILRALSATWNRDDRTAGLLNQDERRVKLTRQEIRVSEGNGIATVEIHDEYANQTYDTQEILLAFTLPEAAAITGLWLGDSADRERRQAFRISPRGAAQAVYRAEVQRGVDPALVEQVGPGQYRLRAFPVPAKTRDTAQSPRLHLWLTYTTLAQDGRWPTPHLIERRNVYWDAATERRCGERSLRRAQDEWVGLDLPAGAGSDADVQQAVLAGGYLVRRELRPDLGQLEPKGQRLAVIVDRSYSMDRVRDELAASLAELLRLGRSNDLDVYLSSARSRGEPALRIDDPGTAVARPLLCFGGGNLKTWLRQFEELRGDTVYHGVFVLTDGDSFDGADDNPPPYTLNAPLWLVHLGGRLAAGYDDAMLELIGRSQGGVATRLADALHRFAARQSDDTIVNVEGRAVWTWRRTLAADSPSDDFARLAARQLLLAMARDRRGAGLDEIHRLAVTYPQVSAYSSMIVLVDERQHQALTAAEAQADRFEREVESGAKSLPLPGDPLSFTATPEPHEWVLIALAAATAIAVLRQRRRARLAAG
jgi:putative PEP-CTERM system integral membrane protein